MAKTYIDFELIAGSEEALDRVVIGGNEIALLTPVGGIPDNICNDCDPPIPDILYATFAGLAGDFAIWNGKWQLEWRVGSSCAWTIESSGSGIDLGYGDQGGIGRRWAVFMFVQYCGHNWWSKEGSNPAGNDPCETTLPFVENTPNYPLNPGAGCLSGSPPVCDPNSCINSAGATCVISYT